MAVPSAADYFPLHVALHGRGCLVVGGGPIAARKVEALLLSGASVTVVAPALGADLEALRGTGRFSYLAQEFSPELIATNFLIIAATDRIAINRTVAAAANAHNRLVNVVDDPALSSFIFPAIVRRGPMVVAISSGGAAPVLARLLRARLEALLPLALGSLARLAQRWRVRVKQQLRTLSERRRFWDEVLADDGPVLRALEAGAETTAESLLAARLQRRATAPKSGLVSLVGAGPGDPELLTLRALHALQRADVILYDRLVNEEILQLARRDAEREYVGKSVGHHENEQASINERLIILARGGKHVVRLKCGDPFIFGRGGEELLALRAHDIDYEVIPGITAAVGCAAFAGIPLTHRGSSQHLSLVTAHCERSLDALDWHGLARNRQTLAFYMGVARIPDIRRQLLAHGRDPATPIAIVERGTLPEQRVLTTTLGELATTAAAAQLEAPAIVYVGEVAALAQRLAWFGTRAVHADAGKPLVLPLETAA